MRGEKGRARKRGGADKGRGERTQQVTEKRENIQAGGDKEQAREERDGDKVRGQVRGCKQEEERERKEKKKKR